MNARNPGKPTAPLMQGDLADTPLPEVLLELHRQALSGTLRIADARGAERLIGLQYGNPHAAQIDGAPVAVHDALLPLFGLPGGAYAFHEDELQTSGATTRRDPFALIGAAIDQLPLDAIAPVLGELMETRVRIQRGKRLSRLELPPGDAALIDLVRAAPSTPRALIAESPLPEARTRRLLYALIVTHAVAPFDTAQLVEEQRKLRGPEPSNRPRVRVVHKGKPGPSLPRKPKRAAPADDANIEAKLELAQQHLRYRRHEQALLALEPLARLHPERADLHGLRAYILFDRDGRGDKDLHPRVRELVAQALKHDAREPRALLLRAIEARNRGQVSKAARMLETIIEREPRNIEAKRELHLLRKRAG